MDVWGKLWDIVTADEHDTFPLIQVDPEDSGRVTLVWPDGSRSGYYFHNGGWQPEESIDQAPCDVAARDAF